MNVGWGEHIVGHVSLVYIYVCPLSALCLVAGYGVGIFYLYGVEVIVVSHLVNALTLLAYVGIVGHHAIIQHLVLFGGEGGGFRG